MKKMQKTIGKVPLVVLTFFLLTVQMPALAKTEKLVPIGKTVGITLDMKGVTVVDTTDVEGEDGKRSAPAKDAGIRIGDLIQRIDGKEVNSAKDLEQIIVGQEGKEVKVLVKRGGEEKELSVKPVRSDADGKYRIGVWIKDAASGIGTVTFLNPETMEFGALGHGISEKPDGEAIAVKGGEILDAKIVSIKKGCKGEPGELVGVFTENEKKLGNVSENTIVGIKGKLSEEAVLLQKAEAIPIADRETVEIGPAEILANVEEGKIERFSVEIQKINRNEESPKGMVVKITDPSLLEKTGGIVQGMSGSPIIQNEKLVGAVTHVFINDPTRGYGIFIENML